MGRHIVSLAGQIVAVVVIGIALYYGWQNRAELPLVGGWFGDAQTAAADGPARPPTPVDVALAKAGSVIVTVEAVGTARANEAVTVSSEVMGIIAEVRFEEGQDVEAGDVLIDFESSVERAEVEVRQAEVAVRSAELQNAQQLFDRARQLIETQNVPMARVDELEAGLQAAKAALRSSEASLKAARARLIKQRVVAPFGGRLGIRHVSQGALIEPGDPIVTLDDIATVKLDFQIPERNIANIRVGQEISAQSQAYPGKVFFGVVKSIDTRVDPVTRAVTVRAGIDNQDDLLKPGMFLLVELGVDTRHEAVLIPEEAIVADGTVRFVYVVADGAAIRKPVTLGQRQPGEVEVLSGVAAGDQVIIGGIQKVRDGAPVAARTATADQEDDSTS